MVERSELDGQVPWGGAAGDLLARAHALGTRNVKNDDKLADKPLLRSWQATCWRVNVGGSTGSHALKLLYLFIVKQQSRERKA